MLPTLIWHGVLAASITPRCQPSISTSSSTRSATSSLPKAAVRSCKAWSFLAASRTDQSAALASPHAFRWLGPETIDRQYTIV